MRLSLLLCKNLISFTKYLNPESTNCYNRSNDKNEDIDYSEACAPYNLIISIAKITDFCNYVKKSHLLPGVFLVNFVHLSGRYDYITPSEINEIPSKIHHPGNNIFCEMGLKRNFPIRRAQNAPLITPENVKTGLKLQILQNLSPDFFEVSKICCNFAELVMKCGKM